MSTTASAETGQLKRVLTTRDLIIYGLVLIQPIAPVGIFGLACDLSKGHVATTIVLAMVAMSITAFSYGRMAILYPKAGSAYVYVGHAFGPRAGLLAGWAMFLDYLVIPIINIIYAALTLQRLIPGIPYVVWVVLITALITVLNVRGVKTTARANTAILAIMSVVIVAFVVFSIRYLISGHSWSAAFSIRPFYNPTTFKWQSVATATSLAALTYIGFDGVTTLAEEVRDPKRSVPRATVLVCLLTGLFSVVEVYLAQLAWPDFTTFANPETAFMDVTLRVGGNILFQAMGGVLIIACIGSGMAGQAGLSRLLYGMGRDRVIPSRLFAYVSPVTGIPTWNVIGIGVLGMVGALLVPYERAAEVLNFGAFLAFMGVNAAVIREYWFRVPNDRRKWLWDLALPAAGLLFCVFIWVSLPAPALIAGGIWTALGAGYLMWAGKRLSPAPALASE